MRMILNLFDMSRSRYRWISKRRLMWSPILLIVGIILMIIEPYEEYSLALLIAGAISTAILFVVIFRDRRTTQSPATHPSSYIQSSYQPSSEGTQSYQPVTQSQDMQTTQTTEGKRFCSHCGAESSTGNKFCESCGQKM